MKAWWFGLFVATGLMVLIAPAGSATGHPYHVSRGEAVLNSETGHLEVSVSVEASSLVEAVEAADGRPMKWSEQDLTRRLGAYVAKRFSLSTATGAKAKIAMAGWAPEGQRVWLHFEVRSVETLHGATIAHEILMDAEPTQVNALRVKAGSFQQTLVFESTQRSHRIDTTKKKKAS